MTVKITSNVDQHDQVCLSFPKEFIFNLIAVLDSGIKRKLIQLAHHVELEQTVAAEIIDNQIKFGNLVLDKLEDMIDYPTDDELEALIEQMDMSHD